MHLAGYADRMSSSIPGGLVRLSSGRRLDRLPAGVPFGERSPEHRPTEKAAQLGMFPMKGLKPYASRVGELIGYARCSTVLQDLNGPARPGLDQALAAVRSGDTLVVPKLDRLARSSTCWPSSPSSKSTC